MSLQDEQAISAKAIEAEDENVNVPTADMQAILKLISMQLEGADQRHTEALGDMYERLQAICNDAQLTQEEAPAELTPALERLQEGIEQLAQLMASEESAAEEVAQPATEPAAQPESQQQVEQAAAPYVEEELADVGSEPADIFDMSSQADFDQQSSGLISHLFPAPEANFEPEERSAEMSADEMEMTEDVFADNAADQVEHSANHQQEGFGEPSPASSMSETPLSAIENAKPANEDLPGPDAQESVAGSVEQPWDLESAEALTRIYESGEAGFAMHPPLVPVMLPGMMPGGSEFEMGGGAPGMDRVDAADQDSARHEPHASEVQVSASAFEVTGASNTTQPIDQDWLEERFAEIAVKVEEAMLALRDDEALEDLSSRFGEFEQRFGDALEDVAKRQDIDALKVAESQIDSMLGYFERVEAQVARIDDLEGQLQSIIERISDDELAQHFAHQRDNAQAEYAEIAETVAETVAQRFLADNGGQGDGAAVSEVRESLEAFMAERREHDAASASMLDTVQQALISVLDRIEAMDSAEVGARETAPSGVDTPDMSQETAHVLGEDSFEQQEEAAGLGPEASAASEAYPQQLEYPASVMGLSGPDEADHHHAMETNDPLHQVPLPQPVESGAGREFDDLTAAQADLAADMDLAPPTPEQSASTLGAGGLPPASPIDRLRQEFIADAKRARQNASEQAATGEEEKPRLASLTSKLSIPKLPKLSIPFGMSKSEAQPEESFEEAQAHAPVIGVEAETQTSRFALTRSRILVGAVIVLFATAGALLMMRGKPRTDAAVPPTQIEQPFEDEAAGPELFEPQQSAPVDGGQQGNLEGGRVYDGEFNYDVAPGLKGKPLASAPAGFAITDLDQQPSVEEISKARQQQAIARMSSDLGVAATYATPASLIPDMSAAQTGGIRTGSVAQAGKTNHLELPPAVVGPLSLRLAAAKGDPSAQFEVGARLASGTGASKDLKSAVRWYKLSAAQGFPQAQYRLGTFYERGVGVDKDLARAKIWYKRAADKGNVKAMHNLAVVTAGREDGRSDYIGAAKWFEMAAQRGLSDSQYNMAVLHESGLGVKKDLKRAYYYYTLAAASGDQQADERKKAVRAKLSPSQITAADRQVELFRPKVTDRIVNDARAAGDDWKKRADHGY